METFNLTDAKRSLSKLVKKAAEGEAFIIAKAGKPMVEVVPLEAEERSKRQRLGFMRGQIEVPDAFNRMGQEEIERMFYGE